MAYNSEQSGTSMHRYRVFGLTFETSVPIPGLTENGGDDPAGVIEVSFGHTPRRIENAEAGDALMQASATEYLRDIPNIARLHVVRDRTIMVEPHPRCSPAVLWSVILGTGGSIVGLRRGHIPLHASAIALDKGAVAFAGQSGAGKSTIAATLVQHGFPLFADDLCLIQCGESSVPLIGGGIPELRLADDAIAALAWNELVPFAYSELSQKSTFRHFALADRLAPLSRLYILGYDDAEPGIYRLGGVEGLETLVGCLRMNPDLLRVGDKVRLFASLGRISSQVAMYRFVRPLGHEAGAPWLQRLISHMQDAHEQ